ncbi:MAG: hypothetical protein ACLTQN_01790 [Blautia massiliensis (ex Durand et al. 2017)]
MPHGKAVRMLPDGSWDFRIFLLKVAVLLRGTILSACLVAVGWKPVLSWRVLATLGMTIAFALVPAAIFCLVGMILLLVGFRITKDKVAFYQSEIDAEKSDI